MPKLVVLSGADVGKQFPLVAPSVTIGRHSGNEIQLTDNRVSRRHLEIRESGTGHQLFDLESGNGTQVNGRLVQVIDLRAGDQIAVGDTVLVFTTDALTQNNADRTRLILQPPVAFASAILRSVAADTGSQILRRPDSATTEWLRSSLANLRVMYEATTAVSQILDVDELLGRIMDLVLRTTEADHGCVMLTDSESGELMPKAVRSRSTLTGKKQEFIVSRTVIDYVLKEKQGVLVSDAGTDDRFRRGESIAKHQIREVICVPMKGRHETVGVIFLEIGGTELPRTAATKFTEDHLMLAVAIAHQAALAIEETRYYQAFVQSERLAAIGQTIAAMSHHIKNIMQGVRFGSDMVRMGLDGDDREMLTKGWRLVEKNQARIDDLILDMLNYSKEREPLLEPTDLLSLGADVIDIVRGRADRSGVLIEWNPVTLPTVVCDPDGIHRALLNLLSNAVDAVESCDQPHITVTTAITPNSEYAEIAVTDNGPGIPPDKLADIFKPFVSTKGSKGTGLGLPVSRKILQEHGGDVLVTTSPKNGTTFTLQIPIRRE